MTNEQLKELNDYYNKNRQKLFAYAVSLTKNRKDAEDLVNDAYLKCRDFIEAGNQITESIAGFLMKTIRYQFIDDQRGE